MHTLFLAVALLTGTWQGSTDGARRVMEITRTGAVYHVVIHSIDETDVPIVTNNVKVTGNAVLMKFDMNTDPWGDYHRTFTAHLSANGSSLSGMWGLPKSKPIPTTYQRVARATWPIILPKTTMVPVDGEIKDEVLDWGGIGRAVVLLAGAGNTGHDFFNIVPALMKRYHVYSITRRGFGNSSTPEPTTTNFSADRLGDDVMSVLQQLHIDKPVMIGHSIAGEELSDIGTRYPARVAGLVYLDAGYGYALDSGAPAMTPGPGAPPIAKALLGGVRRFKGPIDAPILAIFAHPKHHLSAKENSEDAAQIAAFKKSLPTATVITIANADHFVYMSNTDEVLRDINAFIAKLPKN